MKIQIFVNSMVPELHKILYGEVAVLPKREGRIITPLLGFETKIRVGTLKERVASYLAVEGSAKLSEISRGIDATRRETLAILKELVLSGILVESSMDGLPPEYSFRILDCE